MRISKEIQLDYGHTLPLHFGFCSQIHGHRGRVVAYVEGEMNTIEDQSSKGMILDFKFLKKAMMEKIHDVLDHGFAVWKDDKEDLDFIQNRNEKYIITDEPPTAEYLAKWAFNQIKDEIPDTLGLERIEWWETPTSMAEYTNLDYIKDLP